jgi:hypothetical protein
MANGLASTGQLSPGDMAWWRNANDRATASYADPTTVRADSYDATLNPGARSWFKASAGDLLGLTREYLVLLDRYSIGWVELRTSHPGRITYEDDVQVVAVPLGYPEDWPFAPAETRGLR